MKIDADPKEPTCVSDMFNLHAGSTPTPIPILPPLLIVNCAVLLVSNTKLFASFVPIVAVAPKLFPFWINAFAAFVANDELRAYDAEVTLPP